MRIPTMLGAGLLITFSLAWLPSVGAEHNTTDCQPESAGDFLQAGPLYFYSDPGPINVWVYLESNAVDGLQIGALHPTGFWNHAPRDPSAHCGHGPDTVLV